MIRSNLKALAIVTLFSALGVVPLQAGTIEVSFTASNFPSYFDPYSSNYQAAPDDPITGSISYEAASLTAPIESLLSVDLTIAGHSYVIDEIGFARLEPYGMVIGGLSTGGPTQISADAGNDFWVYWKVYPDGAIEPMSFSYSTALPKGVWYASNLSVSVSSSSQVPEYGSSLLFMGIGLIPVCATYRWWILA